MCWRQLSPLSGFLAAWATNVFGVVSLSSSAVSLAWSRSKSPSNSPLTDMRQRLSQNRKKLRTTPCCAEWPKKQSVVVAVKAVQHACVLKGDEAPNWLIIFFLTALLVDLLVPACKEKTDNVMVGRVTQKGREKPKMRVHEKPSKRKKVPPTNAV